MNYGVYYWFNIELFCLLPLRIPIRRALYEPGIGFTSPGTLSQSHTFHFYAYGSVDDRSRYIASHIFLVSSN